MRISNTKKGKIFIAKLDNNETARFNSNKRGEWLAEKLAIESEKQNKRVINYIEDTPYGYSIMYLYNQKLGIKEVYIDTEDVPLIEDIPWCIIEKGTNLYATNGTNHIYLHRLILNVQGYDTVIDHLNHNGLDNRKENLKITTRHENLKNTNLRACNTSGIKGVRYDKNKNAWVAEIRDNNHKKVRRHFACKKYGEDEAKRLAIDFRRQKEIEFGYLNGIDESSETIESDSSNRSE
jgi:hypothetical protein